MIDTVLQNSGFIKNQTYKETRFITIPKETYCVYFDDYESGGADDKTMWKLHGYTIELYAEKADKNAENAIEETLINLNIDYTKQTRYWIEDEKLYQTIYTFEWREVLN